MGKAVTVMFRKKSTMSEYMMKRAFCARCDYDLGMMIGDDEPHPTCLDCIDREMGRWVILRQIAPYLATVAGIAGIVAILVTRFFR